MDTPAAYPAAMPIAVPTPGATAVPAAVAAAFVAVFVATLAVVFAVSFAVSLATVLAVSLAAFFAVFFASFFPASTFLIRFFASAAAFFLKSVAPLEAVPVTGRLASYARYAACDTSCPPSTCSVTAPAASAPVLPAM